MTLANLGDVAEVNPRPVGTPGPDQEVAFVGMADLDAEAGIAKDVEVRRYAEVAKAYTPFLRDDVLVAKITPCFQNRKIGQALTSTPFAVGSTEFHVVRPIDERLDRRYLFHFLRQDWVLDFGEMRMTGSGGQRRVPERVISELKIPLPPLEEQRRIAAVLDAADALRVKRRQAIAKLDSLTQAIFIDMFGEGLAGPGQWSTLADLVRSGDRINYGVVQPGPTVPGGRPLVRVSDLREGRVEHSDVKRIDPEVEAAYKRSRLRGDEVLLSCVGTTGIVALVTEAERDWNIARAVARIPLCDSVNRSYVAAFLRSEQTQRYFDGELRTVSQPTLNIKQIAQTPVLVPPVADQVDFAARVDGVESARQVQRRSLGHFDDLFASLQQRAFRGEL